MGMCLEQKLTIMFADNYEVVHKITWNLLNKNPRAYDSSQGPTKNKLMDGFGYSESVQMGKLSIQSVSKAMKQSRFNKRYTTSEIKI